MDITANYPEDLKEGSYFDEGGFCTSQITFDLTIPARGAIRDFIDTLVERSRPYMDKDPAVALEEAPVSWGVDCDGSRHKTFQLNIPDRALVPFLDELTSIIFSAYDIMDLTTNAVAVSGGLAEKMREAMRYLKENPPTAGDRVAIVPPPEKIDDSLDDDEEGEKDGEQS